MDHEVLWHGHRQRRMKVQHPHGLKVLPVLPNPVQAETWVSDCIDSQLNQNLQNCVVYIDPTTKRLPNSSKAFSGNSSPLNTYTSASDRHKPSVEESLNALTSEMVSSLQLHTTSIKPPYTIRSVTNKSSSRNSVS